AWITRGLKRRGGRVRYRGCPPSRRSGWNPQPASRMTSRVKLRRSNRPASIRAGNRNGRRRAALACAGLLCAAPAAAQPDTWLADFARQMRAAAEAASPPADDAPVTAGVASDVQGNGDASITTTATGLIDVHARG